MLIENNQLKTLLHIQEECSLDHMNDMSEKLNMAEQEIFKLNCLNQTVIQMEPIVEMPEEVKVMMEERMEVK